MAKVQYTKVTPIKKIDPVTFDLDGNEITVIQYLPITEKTNLIGEVLNAVIDTTGYYNPVRLEVWFNVMVIKYYTNISITDKQMEDIAKVYDALSMNKVFEAVISHIPAEEYEAVFDAVEECANNIVNFNSSLLGMVSAINTDYQITKEGIDETVAKIENPDNLTMVKDILEKIG